MHDLALPFLLDGSTGTNLFSCGMTQGVCVEDWILKNPDALMDLQRSFADAGSNGVYAPTFGANRAKLSAYGLSDKVYNMNKSLVAITKKAVGEKALVGGNISPTGLFIKPFGQTSFEELVDIFKEQVVALNDADVDFFIVETMMSLSEARAAVIAVKEVSNKPLFVTMTVEKNGRTLSGNKAEACLVTLQNMGVTAFGLNCSTGPFDMLSTLKNILPYAKVPVIAKPNAGVPGTNADAQYFTPDDFFEFTHKALSLGIGIIGGCCGTTAEHISKIKQAASKYPLNPLPSNEDQNTIVISGEKELYYLSHDFDLAKEIKCSDSLSEDIMDIEDSGCDVIQLRVDTAQDVEILNENAYMLKLPLCVISDSEDTLELCARHYNGTLMINKNSNVEDKVLKDIAKRYGGTVI